MSRSGLQDSDDEYELLVDFYIDDNELDGFTAKECFVLGFQFSQIYDLSLTGQGFTLRIHPCQRERVTILMQSRGRQFELTESEPYDRKTAFSCMLLEVEAM